VDAGVLLHQVPGGMISNLVSQLRDQGAVDKLRDVLEEIPRVRADFGYPPLVTPTSQIVGTQAVLNALFGQRYKQVTKESRAYMLGQYGASPAPVDREAQKAIAGDAKPITGRPADELKPELEKARTEIGELAKGEEDVLSSVLFPQVAREFLEWRDAGAGLENEIVVALAAALARTRKAPEAAPAAADGKGSAWREAGRRRQLRGRG
jgi:pyruvate/oxaloacetate carboxyltransferase